MKNKRNYYRLLHVQMDAPASIINASFRAMMQKLKLHPDLGGDEWNASLLNEARDVLLDKERRAEHDRELALKGYSLFGRRKKSTVQTTAGGTPAPMDTSCQQSANNSRPDEYDTAGEPVAPESTELRESESSQALQLHPQVSSDATPACPFCGKAVIWESAATQLYASRLGCTRCDSPLGPPVIGAATTTDGMRKINRSYFEFVARIWNRWPLDDGWSAMVCDWSTAGCGIELSESLGIGDTVLLRSPGFDAVAVVRHQRRNDAGVNIYGLEYLTLEIRMESGVLHTSAA